MWAADGPGEAATPLFAPRCSVQLFPWHPYACLWRDVCVWCCVVEQEPKLVHLCRAVLPAWCTDADADAFVVAPLLGGLTNVMFTVTAPEGYAPFKAVVRVAPVLRDPTVKKSRRKSEEEKHSILKHPQALFFDRDLELRVLQLASERNISARLLGSGIIEVLENDRTPVTKLARVEEWLEGETLTAADFQDEATMADIATILRSLHDADVSALTRHAHVAVASAVPSAAGAGGGTGDDASATAVVGNHHPPELPRHGSGDAVADGAAAPSSSSHPPSSHSSLHASSSTAAAGSSAASSADESAAPVQSDTQLYHLLHLFSDLVSMAKAVTADEAHKYGVGVSASEALDRDNDLQAEVAWMLAAAEWSRSPLLVVHNDAQPGNWIRGYTPAHDARRLFLIDYEYAGVNYRGFEFGNLFCEYCFDYNHKTGPRFKYSPELYPDAATQRRFFVRYLTCDGRDRTGTCERAWA